MKFQITRKPVLVPMMVFALVVLAAVSAFAQSRRMVPGQGDQSPAAHPAACVGPDCLTQSLDTQPVCQEVTEAAVGTGPGWYLGLSTNHDMRVLGGTVIAYQIQWSNGAWSGWYAKGVNDIDYKFNPDTNTARRMWAYFTDHPHRYIVCR